MNILVFTTAFYPSIGGIEKHTSYLIEEFLKKGHIIKVIAFPIYAGVKEVINTKESKVRVYYNPGFFTVFLLFVWCNVLYMPNFSLKAAWFLLFRPFKKWIISHNDISLSRKSRVKIKITRLLIKLASHNISVSKYIGNYINTNSKIIYNCYDDETFKVYNDEVRKYEIVFLGRLVSQKGCELLIKACATLSCSFTLNVIGNGPERNKLERMVKELCLEKNVHFLGVLEGEQLARVLNRHYIMIIPSMEEEGFGIVALEGMACGCKIIAASAGGLSEAVNGFGKLFEMGNLHQLEKLLKTLLEELRVTTSSEQTANLNEYLAVQSKKAVADKYLELFLEG